MSTGNPHIPHDELWDSGRLDDIPERSRLQVEALLQSVAAGLGPSFYTFYRYPTGDVLYVSDHCESISGYTADTWYQAGTSLPAGAVDEEHSDTVLQQAERCWNFVHALPANQKIRCSVNTGLPFNHKRHINSRHLLSQQFIISLDDDQKVHVCLGAYTDISHLLPRGNNRQVQASVRIPKTEKHFVLNCATGTLFDFDSLTPREKELLAAYGSGRHTKGIADDLFISPYTVQTHRSNLLQKTGCNNLAELRYFARYHSICM